MSMNTITKFLLFMRSLEPKHRWALIISGIGVFFATFVLLGIYLVLKIGDLIYRGTWVYLLDNTVQSNAFLVEVIVGGVLPWLLLLSRRVARNRTWLFTSVTMIIFGVILNRINVFIVSFTPPYGDGGYFPSIGELAITVGLVAGLVFLYRLAVHHLPVLNVGGLEAS